MGDIPTAKTGVEIWVDEAALPDLFWAKVTEAQDGWTVIFFDGTMHLFDSQVAAIAFLSAEDYIAAGEIG